MYALDLVVDIRVPSILQVLVDDVHVALTGCVHEFYVSRLHLSRQTHTARREKTSRSHILLLERVAQSGVNVVHRPRGNQHYLALCILQHFMMNQNCFM